MLCLPLALLGVKQSIEKNAQHIFFVLCLFASFALIILWPALQGLRYAFILLPFLVFYAVLGVLRLNENRNKFTLFISLCVVLMLINFIGKPINSTQLTPRQSTDGAYTKKAKEAWEFIKQNTPQNAMIISFKPRVTYLNTHRLGFASLNVERLAEADFVLITREDDGNMPNPNSAEFKAKTKLVFENGDFSVYEVVK